MSEETEISYNKTTNGLAEKNYEQGIISSNCDSSLEKLLMLEKAARVVCIKYEKMATTFEMQNNFLGHNNLEYSELQKNFKKFNEIHENIINKLEDYLDEYYRQN